jgi:hypothetical protein
MKEADDPMPSGGTTTPMRPFPMNGDGVRATSVVDSRKVVSAGGAGGDCAVSHRTEST